MVYLHSYSQWYFTGFNACGSVCYHTDLRICCEGQIFDKPHAYTGCCGAAPYNTINQTCCEGEIYEKHFQYRCCGSKYYNADKYMCCKSK